MTPTQRSLAHLRKWGYIAAVVEKWNPHARIRQDAFGFGDILAANPESCTRAARAALAKSPYDPTQAFADIVLVQTTTDSNLSARAKKIEGLEAARSWLLAGGRIELHGWGKHGARGKRKVWCMRVLWASLLNGRIVWDAPLKPF